MNHTASLATNIYVLTDFTDLSEALRGLVLIFATIIMLFCIFNFIRNAFLGKRRMEIIIPFIAMLISWVTFQLLVMVQQEDLIPDFPIPMAGVLTVLVILLIDSAYLQYRVSRWKKEHISAMSVKEAFDRLPMGLMFYTSSGIPVMINERIQHIGTDLTGGPVNEGNAFWDDICREYKVDHDGQNNDRVIVETTDGHVYSFRKETIEMYDMPVHEIDAADVSLEYKLTRELEDRRDKARVINLRLKSLMNSIEYTTMNRELLLLKTALHDNIGRSILAARRYIFAPGNVDKEHMLKVWRENIGHLINDEPEEWVLPYYVISKEADRLGIRLNIKGELPQDESLIPVIDAAISVHLGNVLKHADGSEVFISVEVQSPDHEDVTDDIIGSVITGEDSHTYTGSRNGYELRFTNNGKKPDGPVVEKGGLKNLRREVESAGGKMEISAEPEFEMVITLPHGDRY